MTPASNIVNVVGSGDGLGLDLVSFADPVEVLTTRDAVVEATAITGTRDAPGQRGRDEQCAERGLALRA